MANRNAEEVIPVLPEGTSLDNPVDLLVNADRVSSKSSVAYKTDSKKLSEVQQPVQRVSSGNINEANLSKLEMRGPNLNLNKSGTQESLTNANKQSSVSLSVPKSGYGKYLDESMKPKKALQAIRAAEDNSPRGSDRLDKASTQANAEIKQVAKKN